MSYGGDTMMGSVSSESPIQGQLNIQEKRIGELSKKLAELETKVSPVCQPLPPPSPGVASMKDGASGSDIFQKLRSHNHDLEGCIEALNSLFGRLQV